MRQKIFRAILGLSLAVILAVFGAALFTYQYLKTQDEVRNLATFSHIITAAIESDGPGFLTNFHSAWLRISLIAPDGTVIYDSTVAPEHLDNHALRAEVAEILDATRDSTTLRRFSQTLQKESYYHAERLKSGNIIRLSFTSESLFTYTQRFTNFLIFLILALIAGCYYVATKLAQALIEPINSINLNEIKSTPLPDNCYQELHPFLWRIYMQQHKIDEQINELRVKNNEFQTITKSMSDGLVLLNAEGQIVLINKTARRIFAVTKENCLNQSYLTIDNSQYLQDMMFNSTKEPKQSRVIEREGRDYEIRFSVIKDNGQCLGYVLIIWDITEKKRTEQIRQEFTANVSHELKTPLQSIIGYSEMMANGFVKAEDNQYFASRIHKQSTRLKTLIEDIIFLSQLDEGQLALIDQISVNEICHEVFDNLQEKAQERLVRLSVRGNDLCFPASNRYIYELIYNLVDNAIRYNKEQGSVIITLSSTPNKYQIEVKDTGIGIATEDQFRIFERFYRVDKSHSRQTGGTGLGLSIVKRVVLYHQGKIRIHSALGEGTVFTITFFKDKLRELQESTQRKQEALRAAAREAMRTTSLSSDPSTNANANPDPIVSTSANATIPSEISTPSTSQAPGSETSISSSNETPGNSYSSEEQAAAAAFLGDNSVTESLEERPLSTVTLEESSAPTVSLEDSTVTDSQANANNDTVATGDVNKYTVATADPVSSTVATSSPGDSLYSLAQAPTAHNKASK